MALFGSNHHKLAAVTVVATLDISVLGRDVMDLFAVIVDRPGEIVCMIGQHHRYSIEQD